MKSEAQLWKAVDSIIPDSSEDWIRLDPTMPLMVSFGRYPLPCCLPLTVKKLSADHDLTGNMSPLLQATVRLVRSPGESFGLSVAGCDDFEQLAIGQQGILVSGIRADTPAASQRLLT
jgi:hypothetical protein